MLANFAEQASAIVYLVLSIVAGFCLWSRVSGLVAVPCALTWRRPAREKNNKKNKRTRYLYLIST